METSFRDEVDNISQKEILVANNKEYNISVFNNPDLIDIYLNWHNYFSFPMHGLKIQRPETDKALIKVLYCLVRSKAVRVDNETGIDIYDYGMKDFAYIKVIKDKKEVLKNTRAKCKNIIVFDCITKGIYSLYRVSTDDYPYFIGKEWSTIVKKEGFKPFQTVDLSEFANKNKFNKNKFIRKDINLILKKMDEIEKIEKEIDGLVQKLWIF